MNRIMAHLLLAVCVAGLVRADQATHSVQQALKDQGFYYGNVTGDKSAETTAAIRRYQIRNGLQVTGDINPETLRASGRIRRPTRQADQIAGWKRTRLSSALPINRCRVGSMSVSPLPKFSIN